MRTEFDAHNSLNTKILSDNLESHRVNYAFVDWIRMISMIGIIWAHTPGFDNGTNYQMLDNLPVYFFFMDFFKFGVICFFMISGFLLAGKIHTEPVARYFKRRMYATFYPYLFAFAGIVLLFIFKTQLLHMDSSKSVGAYMKDMFLESALWFLPSYWISLAVILCFRRFLNKKMFGVLLLIVTLVYSYFYVYSPYAQSHVHALFAFIFYLWLGYFIAKTNLYHNIQRINVYLLLGSCLLLFVLTSLESIWLYQAGQAEPLSILRISNQLYSVAAFITMMRIFRTELVSRWVNPRKETFGIYLYHMFALALLVFLLKGLSKLGVETFTLHTLAFLPWFILKFIFVYITTLLMVKVLLKLNIGFLNYSGRRPKKTNLLAG